MSYEQKYLKYKQKYQELKKQLGGGAHNLETENYTDIADFSLTDTPTYTDQPKQTGGNNIENENDFNLTDTPTFAEQHNQSGGSPLVMADYTPSAPLSTCSGQVNPSPNVSVPMPGTAVAPAPVVSNKNLVEAEELNTTTDLSEIQNTEDIAKLFGQFGGKHKMDSSSSSSSSSSSDSDSDLSDSDSF